MANLCSNYLKRKDNRLNESECQLITDDDYGFLPWSHQICTKARRQLGTQTQGSLNPALQTNENKENKLQENTQILDNQEYLSPVKTVFQDIQKENPRTARVSPLYQSIDSPILVIVPSPEIMQSKSARRCLNDHFCNEHKQHGYNINMEKREHVLFSNNVEKYSSDSIEDNNNYTQKKINETKGKYLINFNQVECVDESSDQCMSLTDVEDKLHAASVFLPASIMMQTVKTHLPKVPNTGELSITKGVLVTGLFKTRNWVCVKLPTGISGYVPYECVQALGVKPNKDFAQQFPEGVSLKDKVCIGNTCNGSQKVLHSHMKRNAVISVASLERSLCNTERQLHSDQSSQEGIYVLADNIYQHIHSKNYDQIDSNQDESDEEKDRCLLNETIEKSKLLHYQKSVSKYKKRSPVYLNNSLSLTPGFTKLQAEDTKPNKNIVFQNNKSFTMSYASCNSSKSVSNSSDTIEVLPSSSCHKMISKKCNVKNTCDNKCYICKQSVNTTDSQRHVNKKYTCTNCVLSQLQFTMDSRDCGYESARSEYGYPSNVNTQLNGSRSNLLQSIESLNLSDDSGQETYSQNSDNLETVQSCSELTDSEDRGANLTVLFDYEQKDGYDLSIKKQEIVTLLYDRHESWFWVRNRDGIEGYVPKNYVVNLEKLNLDPSTKTTYL